MLSESYKTGFNQQHSNLEAIKEPQLWSIVYSEGCATRLSSARDTPPRQTRLARFGDTKEEVVGARTSWASNTR